MKCGAKCFLVQMEVDGNRKKKTVIARTPAASRKTIRREYGPETHIISVREGKR